MKLLALSVLLLLACAAFVKAENEAPAQEEEDTAVENVQQEDEQAEYDNTALTEENSNEVDSNGYYVWKLICLKYNCKTRVSKRICRRYPNYYKKGHFLHGRRLIRCFKVTTRSCHQICYYKKVYYG